MSQTDRCTVDASLRMILDRSRTFCSEDPQLAEEDLTAFNDMFDAVEDLLINARPDELVDAREVLRAKIVLFATRMSLKD